MAAELELKLRVAPETLPRLQRHALLKRLSTRRAVTRRVHNTYFDTPELDLRRREVALRLRRIGTHWLQTLKGGGTAAAGLHQREELELPVAGEALDLDALVAAGADPAVLDADVRARLAPVFVTDFARTARHLALPGGAQVEVCVDAGVVQARGREAPLAELELELTAGDPAALFELALALQESVPLAVEHRSKAERGYALYAGIVPTPAKAAPVELAPAQSVSDAFRRIVLACLAQAQANEHGIAQGLADPEYVHQMRVALRRMRSAFTVFGPALPRELTLTVREDIRSLARALDPARNWDVFVTETLPPLLLHFSQHKGLAALAADAGRARERGNRQAREMVQGQAYHRALLRLGHWLFAEPWRTQLTPTALEMLARPVAELAQAVLAKRHRQLRRRGEHLAALSPADRHQVRIAAKKLRYAVEFFAGLYPDRPVRSYVKALAAVQDVLGLLNDAATTEHLLHELTQANPGPLRRESAGIVSGWAASRVELGLAHLEEVWDAFSEKKAFWK